MEDFENGKYQPCKEWIAKRIDEGATWESIVDLSVYSEKFDEAIEELKAIEMFPLDLEKSSWKQFVEYYKSLIISIKVIEGDDVVAIDTGSLNNSFALPTGFETLIEWLYSDPNRTNKLIIILPFTIKFAIGY